MDLRLVIPKNGMETGEIHIFGMNEEEYQAVKEEIRMLIEMMDRFERAKNDLSRFKKVIEELNK